MAAASKFPGKRSPRVAQVPARSPDHNGHARRQRTNSGADSAQPVAQHSRYFIESLGRGLAILDTFINGPARLTVGELADHIKLNKATTFRLVRTLLEAGYLQHDASSKFYSLSLKALDLHEATLGALSYLGLAQPFLEELNAEVGEAVNMAVLEDTNVRYVARVSGRSLLSVNLHVGSRLPAHATSMGKVLLAARPWTKVRDLYANVPLPRFTPATIRSLEGLKLELAKVQKAGYAIADEELEPGLRSVAVPIHDSHGSVIAALNIAIPTAHMDTKVLITDLVPKLLGAATGISARLGYRARSQA